METRKLGRSGLQVPALTLGTATFAGKGDFFGAWGTADQRESERLVDIALDAGVTMFDAADVYSDGAAEEALGRALRGRRSRALISTKGGLRRGPGANDTGSSRQALIAAVEGSLRRLGTEYIDLYQLHAYDARTPVEETLAVLDDLVRSGKIRYVGVSNFPGWALMKSLDAAMRHGWPRYVAHQAYYSLLGRDYEWELMPLAEDQGVGALVWSPLGWGRLTGKFRRGQQPPQESRLNSKLVVDLGPPVTEDHLFTVMDVLDAVAAETGKSVPQVALAWVLARPTVSSVIIGARNEGQLRDNLGAVGWKLDEVQIERLDAASVRPAPYPYFPYRLQPGFAELFPPVV